MMYEDFSDDEVESEPPMYKNASDDEVGGFYSMPHINDQDIDLPVENFCFKNFNYV